jgi:hypothetical protein
MVSALNITAALGALIMACMVWDAFRNKDQFWRWCISIDLVFDAMQFLAEALSV